MAEHLFKRVANSHCANQPRAAWVHAHHVFFIGPTGHQSLNIAGLQSFIERSLHLVGGTAYGGCAQMRLRQGLFFAAEFTQRGQLGSHHHQLGLGCSHVDMGFGVFQMFLRKFLGGVGAFFV